MTDPAATAPGIVIVDGSVFFREALQDLLTEGGRRCVAVPDFASAGSALADPELAVVVFDLTRGGSTAVEAFAALRRERPDVRGIVLAGHADQDRVLAALRAGADDYLAKPLHEEELRLALERALAACRTERELARLKAAVAEGATGGALRGKTGDEAQAALELARELCLAVTGQGDAERVTARLMEVLGSRLDAVSAALYLRDPQAERFDRMAQWEGAPGRDRVRIAARGWTGAAAASGSPLIAGEPGDPRFDAEVDTVGELPAGVTDGALLVLPLQFRGRTIGLARVFVARHRVPPLRLLETAAAALSAALRSVLLYRSWRAGIDELARVRRESATRRPGSSFVQR